MIDFHSHILPDIDDGSPSPEDSKKMLVTSKKMGVNSLFLTPHFYPKIHNPDSFLEKRASSFSDLKKVYNSNDMPSLYLGAEVYYFDGISYSQHIGKLSLGDSKYLLIEMPFQKWNTSEINEIIQIRTRRGMIPILAHIDRYFSYNKFSVFDYFHKNGVLFQVNAEFFCGNSNRLMIKKLLKREYIQLVGSDCHNTELRPPNMNCFKEYFENSKYNYFFNAINNIGYNIINNCTRIL